AKHSFTNPDADKFGKQFELPLAYDQQADQQSWAALSKALKSIYKR
ncbi:MAG: dienelactone hydrolase family protein, partial [Candidatus Thiodiazotropha weberae]|nr:dienelactone hydrolase family protein [Candidatus Thiodiazotropha lotti]MCW4212164.1 dienelactone hydrolase family protein [Candidatus Thiodiazotropha lotti]